MHLLGKLGKNFRKPYLINRIHYRPLAYLAETSRQIEFKMREQRNKNINNQFKALESHFGLKRPKQISQKYPKPSTYQFSIQSLRKNSHLFPEYLAHQLKNEKSQYYQVIQKSFQGLSTAQNKQSLQFIEFMIIWKVYLHNIQFEEVVIRKIYQMEMNLNQLFRILKAIVEIEKDTTKKKIIGFVQNKILQHVINIEHYQYQSLFKILNFMRIHNLSPKVSNETMNAVLQNQKGDNQKITSEESFFKIVEIVLLRNINQIPLPSLAQMIIHYANNIKESQDNKIEILTKVQSKVLDNIQFFTHEELIAIMYSYIKTQTHSEKLIEAFTKRVDLLYFQISWENKKKILSLASSLPLNKWIYIVGLSIFELLKGKKVIYRQGKTQTDPNAKQVQFQLLPAIYLASYQSNLMTTQLIQKIQPKILENIFNYSSQDIGLIAWLFTITPPSMSPKRQHKDLLYTKLEAIIVGGFNGSSFTLKDISMLVWSLCNYGGKSNFIYKQNADFWNNIQLYIQQRIANKKQEKLVNSCCQILWAYVNNKPLSIITINMITDILVQRQTSGQLQQDIFNFELITITSFYYSLKTSLPKSIIDFIEKLILKYFCSLVQGMDYLEIMKILKFILHDINDKFTPNILSLEIWDQIIHQFLMDIQRIQYPYIMGVVSFTIASPQGQKKQLKAIQIVTKLMTKKKRLEQLKPSNQEN